MARQRLRGSTRKNNGLLSLLAAAMIFGLPAIVRASVTVQQVEANFSDPSNPTDVDEYAPVNFNGSSTATSASFPGITFTAQGSIGTFNDATDTTYSSHAFTVATYIYGSNSVAATDVLSVYDQTADNLLNGLNVVANPTGPQSLPTGFGDSIQLSNNSYVGTFGSTAADANAVQQLDYIIDNENVVLVAAAVIDNVDNGSSLANQTLPWSAYNGLAVSGDSSNTPFKPGAGPLPGKTHADVWTNVDTGEASYATAAVSGYAVGLIGQAQALGITTPAYNDATNNQVVRSLIMTGADPTAVGAVLGTWTRDTANNLSISEGAGKANYSESLAILNAGPQTLQTATGSGTATSPNVYTTNAKGWAYGSSTAGGKQVIIIYAPTGLSSVDATLNWNYTQQTNGSTINDTSSGNIDPVLGLDLESATLSSGHFSFSTLANSNGDLSSRVTDDNVQHLYYTGDLSAGYYAFLITGDPDDTTNIGFSYDVTAAVPEPGSLGFLVMGGLLLMRRRRSREKITR